MTDDWVVTADDMGGHWLEAGGCRVAAQIGRCGLISAADKREGDGATPCGRWPVRAVYYRPDRVKCPETVLPCHHLTADCGWCDDVTSPDYNRYVSRPYHFSPEQMWRHDEAYDFVVELGYNDAPVVVGHGSAIFLHCIAAGKNSTAGCVAVDRDDLALIIRSALPNQHILILDLLLAD